jgi:tetratricopeptide (TPR) repeat protein
MSMQNRLLSLLFFTMSCGVAIAQSMQPNAPDYNAPYDTLIARGNKALYSGKQLGVATPALAMMYYNRAIEVNKTKVEAYSAKGFANMDYNLIDASVESFKKCLEINPKNPGCLYGIFYNSFLESRKYKLEEIPKELLTRIHSTALAFLAVAPSSMFQEKANAKIIGYVYKLGIDNKDLFLRFSENNSASTMQDKNAAAFEEMLPQVVALNNTIVTVAIYDNLIDYYFPKGNYAKVKELGTKAFATGEAFTNTFYHLGYVLYYEDDNVAEALKVLTAGEAYGPNDKTTNLKRDIYYREGKDAYLANDYPKAISNFQKYTESIPSNERGYAYLGFSNFAAKKYPEAAKALKSLKKNAASETVNVYYPNLDALIAFAGSPGATAPAIQNNLTETESQEQNLEGAIILADLGQYDDALKGMVGPMAYFEKTKNPVNSSWAHMQQGYCYHSMKNYELAKAAYKKSIAAGGYQEYSYKNLALILYGVDNNYAEAEKVLNEGLVKLPRSRAIAAGFAQLYSSQGNAAFDTKDYAGAINSYQKSIQYQDNAETYTFLGFSYYYTQENNKCVEALENAIYLNPDITTTYPAINQVLQALK